MKPRTTLILLVVAVAVFFGIKIYESSNPTTHESELQANRVFREFDRSNLTGFEIKNGGETTTFKKEGETWFLDIPVRDLVDANAMTRLLTSFETLTSKARIDDVGKDKIKEFGLEKPAIRVEFEGKDLPAKLTIGDDTAASGGSGSPAFYARTGDRDTVYVIEGDLKQQLSQSATDFRDRRLMTGRVGEADRMVIHLSGGEIEVKRQDDQWSLEKPFKARGDAQKIRDVIAALTNARIDEFVAEGKAKEDDGLAEPAGLVDLYFDGKEEPETIKFGKVSTAKPEEVYATLSSRIGVFQLPKATASVLENKPADLRDRSLVRLNPDIVDRVTITPAKGDPVQLVRKEEEWIIRSADNRPANGTEVLQFIDNLRNHKVADFVAESASELEKFGLANPVLKVAFSSYASSNTAESAAGENEITEVAFGRTAEGTFAKVEEEPFIVSVDPKLLESIPTSSSAWRSPVVTELDPMTITAIDLRKKGAEPVALTRQQDTWTATPGQVNSVAAQSLANTLAKLRAVRWIGDTAPDQGLSDPTIEITMTTAEESRTLLVGNETPDNMHFAQFKGETGVFLISDPDFKTLTAVLTPEPAPSPAPTAAPTEN